MIVRRSRPDDADRACTVIRRSISELCHLDHKGDATILDKWLSNKTVSNVQRWMAETCLVVAEEAGTIVGVAGMNDAGKITLNYVDPDWRFRGVSKALMGYLETEAAARGISECSLESTQTALKFYRDLGYEVSARSYILPLTGTPALVMSKRIPPQQAG